MGLERSTNSGGGGRRSEMEQRGSSVQWLAAGRWRAKLACSLGQAKKLGLLANMREAGE